MSVDRSVIFITEAPPIDVSETRPPADGPLMGRRLAVKDNVDVFGFLTTAGCPGYAYAPADSAPVVTRLVAAGSTVVGKTNLDQFATGLVGTRSPYGVVPNSRNPDYVSGGSSPLLSAFPTWRWAPTLPGRGAFRRRSTASSG
jgi:allophanate hydrolase